MADPVTHVRLIHVTLLAPKKRSPAPLVADGSALDLQRQGGPLADQQGDVNSA